jgi:hypothetical protein
MAGSGCYPAVGQLSPVSLPVGHASLVVSSSAEVSPELVDGLVVCFSISGVLSLF